MPREIPGLRILPMSDKIEGFRGLSIDEVQQRYFLRRIPADNGRFSYRASGLNARPGTIVLFQFRARIIASAVLVRDEKFDRPVRGTSGVLHFLPGSFRTFDPLDVAAMRKVWPRFRGFGHVKQYLNPEPYPTFRRRLRNVTSPAQPVTDAG